MSTEFVDATLAFAPKPHDNIAEREERPRPSTEAA
jgi:hypothetical protein